MTLRSYIHLNSAAYFLLSVPCDEFVSLTPTVAAIINHMELHLLNTHAPVHTCTLAVKCLIMKRHLYLVPVWP